MVYKLSTVFQTLYPTIILRLFGMRRGMIYWSICVFIFLQSLFASDIVTQSLTWQGVQKQLLTYKLEYAKLLAKKNYENKEFFNLQQQLVAIYLAQKRYQLGFGTAFMPSERSVLNYIHKKTFLDLKAKELLPLYKQKVQDSQKRYATAEFERIQKELKKFEALNLLHVKLFDQYCDTAKKPLITNSDVTEIESIESCIKSLQLTVVGKKPTDLLNWITPVAGKNCDKNPQVWQSLEGAVVLCPDSGTVASIHAFESKLVVFIKKHHFTYVIKGFSKCCVKAGDKLMQGEPLGICDFENPSEIELQLWKGDILLNPSPYHKEAIL